MKYDKFKSYSSYGEDAIFNGILKRLSWVMQEDLFSYRTYLDVGAFHPVKESDTYALYLLGWRGTLVEPNKYFNVLVNENRFEDRLLNIAVNTEPGQAELLIFSGGDSSNTLSRSFADRKSAAQNTAIQESMLVECRTIEQIVLDHIEHFQQIPFVMNIDIEGLDLDVIRTYPEYLDIPFVFIEDAILESFSERSSTRSVMNEKGYAPIATTLLTTLYLKKDSRYFKHITKIGEFE
jgi:FkbM family methyltransferase